MSLCAMVLWIKHFNDLEEIYYSDLNINPLHKHAKVQCFYMFVVKYQHETGVFPTLVVNKIYSMKWKFEENYVLRVFGYLNMEVTGILHPV